MIGWAFRKLAIWGGVGLLFYALIGYRLFTPPEPTGPAPATSTPAASARAPPPSPRQARGVAPNALTFRADSRGHVVLDAVVNGAPVRFLVDTGATVVALSPRDAAAAGLGPNDLSFRASVSTASGRARAAPVTLREVRIGQFSTGDVKAVVIENLGISLLGQTFLKRLDSYEMRDGVLTLKWN